MKLPAYFDLVPVLRVQDPLARTLGCAEDGLLEYGFADAVRLTGHSCPTVASAYWLTFLALEALYPDALPQRGNIKVEFRDDARTGTNGVVATVIQMLTGAAGNSGFKGLGGRFGRAGLIRYRPDILLSLRFTRLDTGDAVDAGADLSFVPADAALAPLLERFSRARLTLAEEALLGQLWQARVREILLRHGRDPAVFMVGTVQRRANAVPLEPLAI